MAGFCHPLVSVCSHWEHPCILPQAGEGEKALRYEFSHTVVHHVQIQALSCEACPQMCCLVPHHLSGPWLPSWAPWDGPRPHTSPPP